MFTGIIEQLGEVVSVEKEGTNIHFTIKSAFTHELFDRCKNFRRHLRRNRN